MKTFLLQIIFLNLGTESGAGKWGAIKLILEACSINSKRDYINHYII